MSGARGDDTAPSGGRDVGARPRPIYLVGGGVLAVAATAALILTDNPRLLKVAVIVAVWACVLALLAGVRPRAEEELSSAREEELRHTFELELDREVAARREYELRLEVALRRELENSLKKDLGEVRSQIGALRKEIADRSGGELRLERFAVRAESTRLSGGDRQALQQQAERFGLELSERSGPAMIEHGTASFPAARAAEPQPGAGAPQPGVPPASGSGSNGTRPGRDPLLDPLPSWTERPDRAGPDRPASARPAADRTTFDRPTFDRPVSDRAASDRPASDRPASDRPASDRLASDRTGPDRLGPDRLGPDRLGPDRAIGSQLGFGSSIDLPVGVTPINRAGRPDAQPRELPTGPPSLPGIRPGSPLNGALDDPPAGRGGAGSNGYVRPGQPGRRHRRAAEDASGDRMAPIGPDPGRRAAPVPPPVPAQPAPGAQSIPDLGWAPAPSADASSQYLRESEDTGERRRRRRYREDDEENDVLTRMRRQR